VRRNGALPFQQARIDHRGGPGRGVDQPFDRPTRTQRCRRAERRLPGRRRLDRATLRCRVQRHEHRLGERARAKRLAACARRRRQEPRDTRCVGRRALARPASPPEPGGRPMRLHPARRARAGGPARRAAGPAIGGRARLRAALRAGGAHARGRGRRRHRAHRGGRRRRRARAAGVCARGVPVSRRDAAR